MFHCVTFIQTAIQITVYLDPLWLHLTDLVVLIDPAFAESVHIARG